MAVVSGASTSEVKDALAGIGIADYFDHRSRRGPRTASRRRPYTQAITRLGVSAGRSI
jgi:phosphoglycolate phosphatase-like HAD superfamily hydrolase